MNLRLLRLQSCKLVNDVSIIVVYSVQEKEIRDLWSKFLGAFIMRENTNK